MSEPKEMDVPPKAGAKCGALPGDSDLERIIELWSDLPDETRRAMRLMAEASISAGGAS